MTKPWWKKLLCYVLVLLAVLVLLVVVAIDGFRVGSVKLPEVTQVEKVVHLDQGWPDGWDVGGKQWFHHVSQGTFLIDYNWFLSLERPELSFVRSLKLFSSPEYLHRFGFIPSESNEEYNPDGLPVGFTVEDDFKEPYTDAKPPFRVLGFTCSTCHTAQINYKGIAIRIDGGPGLADLLRFRKSLAIAVFYTYLIDSRFERFADRILGNDADAEKKDKLRQKLKEYVEAARRDGSDGDGNDIFTVEPGFGRIDALGLILNRVFGEIDAHNRAIVNSPVKFPHIWDAPWFEWVEYNASIRTPLVRNIGEALGVGALLNTDPNKGELWDSTVNLTNLHLMEKQLAGERPFDGLRSPKWPEDILTELEPELVKKGKDLYDRHCIECHWRIDDVEAALEAEDETITNKYWTKPNRFGRRFIQFEETTINLERIGTDPGQAIGLGTRTVVLEAGQTTEIGAVALDVVTNRVRQRIFQEMGLFDPGREEERMDWDGYRVTWEDLSRENAEHFEFIAAEKGEPRTYSSVFEALKRARDSIVRLGYRARPLNGVWATAPFLHNGSVPNLYELLSPVSERSRRFYRGNREFDPKHVGYLKHSFKHGFEFDTSITGNHNTGHEFRNRRPDEAKFVKGVIGPGLTHEERMALIEYLKTL